MSNGLIRSAIKALLPYRRFRYRPLENGYFRLLILHPGKRTDDLRCDIITEPLNTIINYFALSYVWGSPKPMRPYNLRTKYLGIGPNLEEALLSLRHEKLFLTLWVDALCINQGDLEERAQQVEHMYTIFKNAKKVVAWLGKEQE
ncbi:uncharacterized protein K452DRAFT_279237, partial [Aplosporella prunicola CBS 121167]